VAKRRCENGGWQHIEDELHEKEERGFISKLGKWVCCSPLNLIATMEQVGSTVVRDHRLRREPSLSMGKESVKHSLKLQYGFFWNREELESKL
jgi:hypothetical protein